MIIKSYTVFKFYFKIEDRSYEFSVVAEDETEAKKILRNDFLKMANELAV